MPIEDLAPERTWVMCKVSDGTFQGRGGAPMLGVMLRAFLDWARETPFEPSRPAV